MNISFYAYFLMKKRWVEVCPVRQTYRHPPFSASILSSCPCPSTQLTRTILFRTFAKGAGVSYNGVDMAEKSTADF